MSSAFSGVRSVVHCFGFSVSPWYLTMENSVSAMPGDRTDPNPCFTKSIRSPLVMALTACFEAQYTLRTDKLQCRQWTRYWLYVRLTFNHSGYDQLSHIQKSFDIGINHPSKSSSRLWSKGAAPAASPALLTSRSILFELVGQRIDGFFACLKITHIKIQSQYAGRIFSLISAVSVSSNSFRRPVTINRYPARQGEVQLHVQIRKLLRLQ